MLLHLHLFHIEYVHLEVLLSEVHLEHFAQQQDQLEQLLLQLLATFHALAAFHVGIVVMDSHDVAGEKAEEETLTFSNGALTRT